MGVLFEILKAGVEENHRDQRQGTVVAAVSDYQGTGMAVSALHTSG